MSSSVPLPPPPRRQDNPEPPERFRDPGARVGNIMPIEKLFGLNSEGHRRRVRKSSGKRHWGYWA